MHLSSNQIKQYEQDGYVAPIDVLSKDEAKSLVEQTLLGAAALLYESDDPAEVLRQKVTSKGGTTAAAIEVFENASFRDTIRAAVFAATERSLQLGDE